MENAYSMTFRQLSAAASGYEMRRRDEWERSLMLVNAFTGANLSYDKLTSQKKVTTKEDFERLKKKWQL